MPIPRSETVAMTVLIGILISLVGLGVPGLYSLGALSENVHTLNNSMNVVTSQITKMAEKDIADLRKRIIIMEQKQILPLAVTKFDDLEGRVRRLEGRE